MLLGVPESSPVLGSLVAVVLLAVVVAPACGQDELDPTLPSGLSPAAERLRALSDPKSEVKKARDRRSLPPFEFFRTQVAPSEVIPFVKPNQWVTMAVEMRANHADYAGSLRTAPVQLLDMPHRIRYERDATLIGGQDSRLGVQAMFPTLPKERNELDLELIRSEAIRGDGVTQAILQRLLPHQMLVPVLGIDSADYMNWGRLQAILPASVDRDPASADRYRYYRLLASQDPERPLPLSSHPLTWTSISHLIWDGQDPEAIDVGQQQAMLDWLHWGGQLIVVGGAGPSLAPLQDSFLEPVLPATSSGRNISLEGDDFATISQAFLAPYWPIEGETGYIRRYIDQINPIRTTPDRPIFLSGLNPKPGAETISLGDESETTLGVEWRVGRGRVLMLALKPTDAALQNWPGLDTWVRRVMFRRPAEPRGGRSFSMLPATHVSWLRYVARDLGAPETLGSTADESTQIPGEVVPPAAPLASWLDSASLPVEARRALEDASGITIPGSNFVLRVILAYIVALVPLNWLICTYLVRRREWAWVATPILALGFAVAVERAAAYDLGFDTACDEIDLVEIQGGYARAHVSRFAALYSTGRVSYDIAYPDEPSALALPMSLGGDRYQRGEDLAQSTWSAYPVPTLGSFPVQPRSVSMFRAEQMDNLPGGISLIDQMGERSIVNQTGLELRDAEVLDVASRTRYRLGTIGPDATVSLDESLREAIPRRSDRSEAARSTGAASDAAAGALDWIEVDPFLAMLREYDFGRPEDRGEWRLVAWTPDPHPGQELTPAVDRHRGFRLVVAHLDYGPVPAHDSPDMIGDGPGIASILDRRGGEPATSPREAALAASSAGSPD